MKIYSDSRKRKNIEEIRSEYDSRIKELDTDQKSIKSSAKDFCKQIQADIQSKFKGLDIKVYYSNASGVYGVAASIGGYSIHLTPLNPDLGTIGNYNANRILLGEHKYNIPVSDIKKLDKLYKIATADLSPFFENAPHTRSKREYQDSKSRLISELSLQILEKYEGRDIWVSGKGYWSSCFFRLSDSDTLEIAHIRRNYSRNGRPISIHIEPISTEQFLKYGISLDEDNVITTEELESLDL